MALWVRNGFYGESLLFSAIFPSHSQTATKTVQKKGLLGTIYCSLHQETDTQMQLSQHNGIICDLCSGSGWLICDFCRGQKTNVKSKSSRFYRRCPDCKAVGLVLCPKCKVYKCVTLPDSSD